MIENKVFKNNGEVNPDLLDKNNKIYILSTDIYAKYTFFTLLQNEVPVSGFASEKSTGKLYSLPIVSFDETADENSVYVICESNWEMCKGKVDESRVYLIDSQYAEKTEFTFKENGGGVKKCNAALMITMILSRTKGKKPVFLIQSESLGFWENLLSVLGNEVVDASIISVDLESEKIYDFLYYDLNELLFFVAVFDYKEIALTLKELGRTIFIFTIHLVGILQINIMGMTGT